MGKINLPTILTIVLTLGLLAAFPSRNEKSPSSGRPQQLRIPIWVRDSSGEFQRGLAASDFRVYDGDTSLEVSGVDSPETPTLLFVALDTVGDIANIDHARAALKLEVRRLGSHYRVGLISAREQIAVLQDPTPDRKTLLQKLDTFSQIGKAGLLETILSIAEFSNGVLQRSRARVAVIFVTDSDIGNYRQDYLNPPVNYSDSRDLSRRFAGRALQEKISHMVSQMAGYQAPIFVVHIDPAQDPLNRAYQNGLKQLAESVEGQLLLSKAGIDIATMIQEAFRWASGFYVLNLTVPQNRRDVLKIRVHVAENPDGAGPSAHLTYSGRILLKR